MGKEFLLAKVGKAISDRITLDTCPSTDQKMTIREGANQDMHKCPGCRAGICVKAASDEMQWKIYEDQAVRKMVRKFEQQDISLPKLI